MDVSQSIVNGVLSGRNGHLFLAGGAHHVLDYALGKRELSETTLARFEKNLIDRAQYARSVGVRYLHLLSPDKQSVLERDFPVPDAISVGQKVLARCSKISSDVLFPLALLREKQDECFLHTDTHLTDMGNASVAAEVASRLLDTPQDEQLDDLRKRITRIVSHCGDLGSKLTPPVSHSECCVRDGWGSKVISNRLKSNDGIVDIWVSPSGLHDARVMVFGDSFGRDLSRFLSFWFTQTLFLRTPFMHIELAEQFRPDFLITQNVERYLGTTRGDDERPDFHLFPYLKERPSAFEPDASFGRVFSAVLSVGRPPYTDFRSQYLKAYEDKMELSSPQNL